jgi:hypothetical protein
MYAQHNNFGELARIFLLTFVTGRKISWLRILRKLTFVNGGDSPAGDSPRKILRFPQICKRRLIKWAIQVVKWLVHQTSIKKIPGSISTVATNIKGPPWGHLVDSVLA